MAAWCSITISWDFKHLKKVKDTASLEWLKLKTGHPKDLAGEDVAQPELSYAAGVNIYCYNHYAEQYRASFLKTKEI